jgi:hypothetical protein
MIQLRHRTAHPPAFLGAMPAGLGAAAAMVVVMPGAFGGAGFADIGANAANSMHLAGIATHVSRGEPADVGAIDANPCTVGTIFLDACVAAVVAFLRTSNACLNT